MNVDRAVQRAETKIESIPTYLGTRIRPYSKLCATLIEAIHIDSPFTTTFVALCFLVQLITATVPGCGSINSNYFGVPPFSHFIFTDVVSWFRLFSHVLGHGSWSHLNGNVVNLLLVGPACERHFGSSNIVKIIFYVGITSGIAHMLFGPPDSIQLGASGVVFAFILLNSLIEISGTGSTGIKGSGSGISHIAHLVGAVVGVYAGFKLHPPREDIHPARSSFR